MRAVLYTTTTVDYTKRYYLRYLYTLSTVGEMCWVCECCVYTVNVGELSVEMKCISLTVLTCALWARIYYYFFSLHFGSFEGYCKFVYFFFFLRHQDESEG